MSTSSVHSRHHSVLSPVQRAQNSKEHSVKLLNKNSPSDMPSHGNRPNIGGKFASLRRIAQSSLKKNMSWRSCRDLIKIESSSASNSGNGDKKSPTKSMKTATNNHMESLLSDTHYQRTKDIYFSVNHVNDNVEVKLTQINDGERETSDFDLAVKKQIVSYIMQSLNKIVKTNVKRHASSFQRRQKRMGQIIGQIYLIEIKINFQSKKRKNQGKES